MGITLGEGAGTSFSEPNGESYFVHNNNWNDNAGGVSTIVACNYNNWYAISDTPDHGDLSVQTYLNVHRDYTNGARRCSTIQSARFAATGPQMRRVHLQHRLRHLDRERPTIPTRSPMR